MIDLNDDELAARLSQTLHAKADQTPRIIGRRPLPRRRRNGWVMPITATAVIAAGVAGIVIGTTRSSHQADEPPTTNATLVDAPAATGVLLTPPPDTPGLRLGTGANIEPWAGGVLTTGAVASPSGRLVIIQNDPGTFPSADDPGVETRDIGGLHVVTTQGIDDVRTYAIESPCSNPSIAAMTDEPVWTGDLQTLLEATSIGVDGAMHVDLPHDWVSYGGGRLGPGFHYQFTISIDGVPTRFTVLQRFDTDIGATTRRLDETPTTFDGTPALIYGQNARVLIFADGPDTISLAGAVDADTLTAVAHSLGRHDVTVDLDAYRSQFPSVTNPTCPGTITITP